MLGNLIPLRRSRKNIKKWSSKLENIRTTSNTNSEVSYCLFPLIFQLSIQLSHFTSNWFLLEYLEFSIYWAPEIALNCSIVGNKSRALLIAIVTMMSTFQVMMNKSSNDHLSLSDTFIFQKSILGSTISVDETISNVSDFQSQFLRVLLNLKNL